MKSLDIVVRIANRTRNLTLLTLGLITFQQDLAAARTLRVPNDATTLQAAIDAAVVGDQILVAPGTYTGAGNKNLTMGDKDLVIRSEGGPEVTILDLQGTGRAFFLVGPYTRSAIVEGFTIAYGDGNQDLLGGGGMFIGGGSPTIRRCVFRKNQAPSANFTGGGGGLACQNSGALIEDCEFIQNSVVRTIGAVGGGLAAYDSAIEVRRCRFVENQAPTGGGGGGGVYIHRFSIEPEPTTIFESCEFIGNVTNSGGGGANLMGARLTGCVFTGNQARGGGGVTLMDSEMTDCTISGNTAVQDGGGVTSSGSDLVRCVITENTAGRWGGGLIVHQEGHVEQTLISDNTAGVGGGIFVFGPTSTVEHCTIVRNRAPQSSGIAYPNSNLGSHGIEATIVAYGVGGVAIDCAWPNVTASCCDLFGNEGGDWTGCLADEPGTNGNFSADPRFCGLGQGKDEFTLAANSPCLPGNHPQGANCGIIGSEGEGCAALAVEATTWGTIKNRYQK